MKLLGKKSGLNREYAYASHHHLIPLYILNGISLVGLLVIACFVAVMWQNTERDDYRPLAAISINAVENQFISSVVAPAEKKQYVYPANIRFAVNDPYDTLRYSYDPGMTNARTSSTVALTTSAQLKDLEAPLLNNPKQYANFIPNLQQCSRLYVVRFEPGVTPFGGFTPLQDIKLKDGRTAYVHKNTACVPNSAQAMTKLETIEKAVLSVESF